ncbi:hypothetical protein [Alkalilimnicola ehrlichii]|uniref:Uncharacterized protein n=1 Tax=Alkalilimnicola ehrlichii TaxID=351052 RepID=A0A3E0X3W3_9GAMM|nr:hypothetical protein [Alkalilimnicola ehrlichii]RFA39365.1 hypothetical protein CAL65_00715 [Alkalilimnicola ehrlichii]
MLLLPQLFEYGIEVLFCFFQQVLRVFVFLCRECRAKAGAIGKQPPAVLDGLCTKRSKVTVLCLPGVAAVQFLTSP